MRRRRYRSPNALRLVPRKEVLEPRQLLTGTVSDHAEVGVIKVPYTMACAPYGFFDLNLTGAPSGYIDYTVTSSGGPPAALAHNGASIPTSGTLYVDGSSPVSLVPDPSRADVTYTLTLSDGSESAGCCCGSVNNMSAASPSTATITYHFEQAPAPQPPPFCLTCSSPLAGSFNPQASGPIVGSTSGAGVQYATGAVAPTSGAQLGSGGYGGLGTGFALGWTNLDGYDPTFGLGMDDGALPWIEPGAGGSIVAVAGAGAGIFFAYDSSTSTYSPEFYVRDTLVADGSGGYLLTQDDGSTLDFYGFGSGVPAAQQGQLASMTDAAGNVTTTTYNPSGQLTAVGRTDGTTAESYVYTYVTAGVNAGLVSNLALKSGPAGGTLSTVQQVAFTYYDGNQAGGDARELEEQTLEDASGASLGTTYYRYYTAADLAAGAVGYAGGLEYQLGPQSYARLAASLPAGTTPETATDVQIAPYADQYYQYDSQRRVTETVVQGAGCSCSGSTGEGTFTYAYTTSTNAAGPNSWQTKTVETLPDGSQNIVFSNSMGEVMFKAFYDVSDASNPANNGKVWATDYRYDAAGRLVLTAQPSAVSINDMNTLNVAAAANPDIVGYVA